jgi:hypothetical protein
MSFALRARSVSGEPCVICGVPAGTVCRNPFSGSSYGGVLHDQPVDVAEDARSQAISDVAEIMLRAKIAPATSKRSPAVPTTNATPTILLDEPLPAINGAVVYVEALVAAATTPAFGNFRMWRRAAMLVRTAGTWSVLGGGSGIVDLTVPPASAGASSWVMTPSLPGGDILRLTGTGQAATNIAWVAALDLLLF